ncbi:hypothetical protein IE988_17680 [Klebsiella pneumoniae]|uniref:Uncharacterized protein n=1 Tax=Klebsiella pneumoniae TaxID=573 RepID=A0A927DVZ1_KLEPN|nr:hypothetical protein [Klebsiella pneumoniae]
MGWPAGRFCSACWWASVLCSCALTSVAKPSQMAGVPYAVICRQAFGVFGANIPAVIRGLIASPPVRYSNLSGGERPDAGPAQVLALPFLADQQQFPRAVDPWLALLRHHVAAAGDGVLARHERHQAFYRYRRSGGVCGDVGPRPAGLYTRPVWMGSPLPSPANPSALASRLADDHRHGAGRLLLLRAAAQLRRLFPLRQKHGRDPPRQPLGAAVQLPAVLGGHRGDSLRHPVAVRQNDHRPD